MGHDYLWDKEGPPDPEIERLERLLGRFASVPPVPALPPTVVRWGSMRTLAPLLATAAAVLLMAGGPWRLTSIEQDARTGWAVSTVAGAPRIGGSTLKGDGSLPVGKTLVTDVNSSARLAVGQIGEVTVEPNTRVRLLSAQTDHQRLALDRGTVRAFILAPPGNFIVDTPSATAVDLGCAYTLNVDEDGAGLLSVEVGWVGFEWNGRESFVPAKASCPMRPRLGPGTPRYDDADPAIKAALETFDYGRDGGERSQALHLIFERARPKDALTLWHLLSRVDAGTHREEAYNALAARVAPPKTITREAVLRLDREALDAWWKELGLYDAAFWRKWKGDPFKDYLKPDGK